MDKNGNKTGGRQKGTPNKINASIKVRIKDFLIKTEDAMMDAFMRAKPNERLNFWFKMANFICAKQTSSKDDGEWRPGEGIVADWSTNDQWYQNDMEVQHRTLLENRKRNAEQAAQAIAFNECKQAISTLSPQEAKKLMQLFPNEQEGKTALYTILKGMLDRKIDDALEYINKNGGINYSQKTAPQPVKPVNRIYDEVDNEPQSSNHATPEQDNNSPENLQDESTEQNLFDENSLQEDKQNTQHNPDIPEPHNENDELQTQQTEQTQQTTNSTASSNSHKTISPLKKAMLKRNKQPFYRFAPHKHNKRRKLA